jgi:hypothetical protein
LAAQKKIDREKKLEDNKKDLVTDPKGEVRAKIQKNTQARKIVLEMRRVAGDRKTIAFMHMQMIAKGQRIAAPKLKLASDRKKAGPVCATKTKKQNKKTKKQKNKKTKKLKN